MPPLYTWFDSENNYEVDVFKGSFDQSSEPPLEEELPEEEKGKKRKWEKRLGKNIRVTRGPNWNGSKGNW